MMTPPDEIDCPGLDGIRLEIPAQAENMNVVRLCISAIGERMGFSVDDIEESLIGEHAGKSGAFNVDKEKELIRSLMLTFAKEKDEGERVADFEKRVKADGQKILA